MAASAARRQVEVRDLFDQIGDFLAAHRLSPDPAHYAFAHRVVSSPHGDLARAVDAITDGGVRLSRADIEELGGEALPGAPAAAATATVWPAPPPSDGPAEALLARTQAQVEGFADTVRAIHAETSDFGRDLAASAAAMSRADPVVAIDEIARITGAMIERIHSAELRLAAANREVDSLKQALGEAQGSARQDPLTELGNRRAFDEAFARFTPDEAIAIAVCDIDHFKRVNDEFGHAVGDRVLKAIGDTLQQECEGFLVTRYGGEEFALIGREGDLDAAWAAVDRARSAVAARRFRSRETEALIGAVTISAGIATGRAGQGQEALLARADAALYRAKAAGRNRTFRAPESGA